jgi:hypothetical protein
MNYYRNASSLSSSRTNDWYWGNIDEYYLREVAIKKKYDCMIVRPKFLFRVAHGKKSILNREKIDQWHFGVKKSWKNTVFLKKNFTPSGGQIMRHNNNLCCSKIFNFLIEIEVFHVKYKLLLIFISRNFSERRVDSIKK